MQLAFFLREVKTAIGTTARCSMWNLTSWLKEKDAAILDMHEPLLKSDGRYRQSILLQAVMTCKAGCLLDISLLQPQRNLSCRRPSY